MVKTFCDVFFSFFLFFFFFFFSPFQPFWVWVSQFAAGGSGEVDNNGQWLCLSDGCRGIFSAGVAWW